MSFSKSLVLAVALAAAGCSSSPGGGDDPGSGDVTLDVNVRSDALMASSAGIVWLHLTGVTNPAFSRWYSATPIDGLHTFSIYALPVGDYSAMVYAWVDNGVDPTVLPPPIVGDWETPLPVALTITRGNNTFGRIWLQQTAPAGTVTNTASSVNSLLSSLYFVDSGTLVAPAVPAEPVSLAVTLSDLDGDAIRYTWAESFTPAAAGPGTFAPGATGAFAATAPLPNNVAQTWTWTAPTGYVGDVTLTLTITDGNPASPVTTVVAVPLKVGNFGRGNASIPIAINGLPDIVAFSSTKGTLVADGLDTALITLEASDDAVDTLVATFTAGAGCGPLGPVSSAQVGTVTLFQATYTAAAAAGPCPITASVTDGRPGTTPTVGSLTLNQSLNVVQYAPLLTTVLPLGPLTVNVTYDAVLGLFIPSSEFEIVAVNPFTNLAYPPGATVFTTTDLSTDPLDPTWPALQPFSDPLRPDSALATYIPFACPSVGPVAAQALSYTVTATTTDPVSLAAVSNVWPVTVNCPAIP